MKTDNKYTLEELVKLPVASPTGRIHRYGIPDPPLNPVIDAYVKAVADTPITPPEPANAHERTWHDRKKLASEIHDELKRVNGVDANYEDIFHHVKQQADEHPAAYRAAVKKIVKDTILREQLSGALRRYSSQTLNIATRIKGLLQFHINKCDEPSMGEIARVVDMAHGLNPGFGPEAIQEKALSALVDAVRAKNYERQAEQAEVAMGRAVDYLQEHSKPFIHDERIMSSAELQKIIDEEGPKLREALRKEFPKLEALTFEARVVKSREPTLEPRKAVEAATNVVELGQALMCNYNLGRYTMVDEVPEKLNGVDKELDQLLLRQQAATQAVAAHLNNKLESRPKGCTAHWPWGNKSYEIVFGSTKKKT